MNKDSYLSELDSRLTKLPYSEREEAMRYYNEYFNEAGPQREVVVIEELGPPSKVAAQILAEFTSGQVLAEAPAGTGTSKKSVSSFYTILLGILAAPIALPIGLAAIIVLGALVFCVAAVAMSLAFAAIACVAAGFAAAGVGVSYFATDFATGLAAIGAGLTVAGIGLAFFIPVKAIIALLKRFVLASAAKVFNRVKGDVQYEKEQ